MHLVNVETWPIDGIYTAAIPVCGDPPITRYVIVREDVPTSMMGIKKDVLPNDVFGLAWCGAVLF